MIEENYSVNSNRPFIIRIIICLCISSLIIVGLRYRVIMIGAAVLSAAYLCVIPVDCEIETLFFLLSFVNVFKLSVDSSSIFTYIQIIPILKLLFNTFRSGVDKKEFCSTICFIGYAVMLTLKTYTSFAPAVKLIILMFLLLFLLGTELWTIVSVERVSVSFAIGILTASLWGCLRNVFPEIQYFLRMYYSRTAANERIFRFSALTENSNVFSIDVTIAIVSLLLLYKRGKINKIFYLLIVPLCIFGVMSQSKTFVICLLILVSYYLISINRKDLGFVALGIMAFLSVRMFVGNEITGFFKVYLGRFSEMLSDDSGLNSVTSGRTSIWSSYIHLLASDWKLLFWGAGLDKASKTIGSETHNFIIQALYTLGIIGSIFYGMAVMSFKRAIDKIGDTWIFILLLLIRLLSANLIYYTNTYYYLLLMYLLIRFDENNIFYE